jgi:hypothetical protein
MWRIGAPERSKVSLNVASRHGDFFSGVAIEQNGTNRAHGTDRTGKRSLGVAYGAIRSDGLGLFPSLSVASRTTSSFFRREGPKGLKRQRGWKMPVRVPPYPGFSRLFPLRSGKVFGLLSGHPPTRRLRRTGRSVTLLNSYVVTRKGASPMTAKIPNFETQKTGLARISPHKSALARFGGRAGTGQTTMVQGQNVEMRPKRILMMLVVIFQSFSSNSHACTLRVPLYILAVSGASFVGRTSEEGDGRGSGMENIEHPTTNAEHPFGRTITWLFSVCKSV